MNRPLLILGLATSISFSVHCSSPENSAESMVAMGNAPSKTTSTASVERPTLPMAPVAARGATSATMAQEVVEVQVQAAPHVAASTGGIRVRGAIAGAAPPPGQTPSMMPPSPTGLPLAPPMPAMNTKANTNPKPNAIAAPQFHSDMMGMSAEQLAGEFMGRRVAVSGRLDRTVDRGNQGIEIWLDTNTNGYVAAHLADDPETRDRLPNPPEQVNVECDMKGIEGSTVQLGNCALQ